MVRLAERREAWEPVPGWYVDPAERRQQRFWDGSQWTQQVRPNKRLTGDRRNLILLIIGCAAGLVAIGYGLLTLVERVEERSNRPGLEKTLNTVQLPADIRLVGEDYYSVMCLDVCPTLTRRYSSPRSREETYQVFAAELERLGYQCRPSSCGQLDGSAWVQPGEGERSREFYLQVLFTTDLDADESVHAKDAGRAVHADLSLQ